MFQIDRGSGVAMQPFGLGDSKAGSLADDVAQAYKLITFNTHIYPYTPSRNIDFLQSS